MYFKLGNMIFATGKDKIDTSELGATGTVIFNGILQETGEYLTEFKPLDKQRDIIERMRRSDGQVKAGLLALTLPLHSAHWDIEAASKDAKDQEVADFVRKNLFEGMTITWNDFLRHVLLMLPFGFSVFEKVWELRDGQYCWRKLAPRLPRTIYRWFTDPEGGLAGIQQWVWKESMFIHVNIPVEKLLVFSHEREGSNFEGISVLRAAYKHWYYKNTLYAIDGIAAERHGVGVAHFQYPATASVEQKKKIEEIGERLHAHERAYVALPEGITFDLKGVAGQLYDIKGSIDHHDVQILRSILAQFISLGAKSTGSYALSQDQSDFFLMALRSTGKNICDTINTHAIKQLVDYNFNVDAYPKLAVSDLDYLDVAKLSAAINQLVTAGALTPDDGIETELRRLMHLPAMKGTTTGPAEQQTRKQTPEQAPTQPAPSERPTKRPKPDVTKWPGGVQVTPVRAMPTTGVLRGRDFWREPTELEKNVEFKEMVTQLDSVQSELVTTAKKIQDKQIKRVVEMVVEDVKKGDIQRISTIDIPYRNEMTKAVESALTNLYDYGNEQVKNEARKQGAKLKAQEATTKKPDYQALIRTRALATANVLANKLRATLAWEALSQISGNTVDAEALTAALVDLSDRELIATASFSTSEALNMGRASAADELGDSIERVTSSALMDNNTCDYCEGEDKKSWVFGQQPSEPPYNDCEGRDKCRCVFIYTFKSEVGG